MKFFSLILLFFSVSALPLGNVPSVHITSGTPEIISITPTFEEENLDLLRAKVQKIMKNVFSSYLKANSKPFLTAAVNPKTSSEVGHQVGNKLIVTSEIGSGLNRPLLPVAFHAAAA